MVRSLPAAGVLLVAAVVAFTWATATIADPAVTTPTGMQIAFHPDPNTLTAADLPPTCAGLTIRAVAVGGTLQRPIVISTSDRRCLLNHHRLSAEAGFIVPDIKTP